MDDREILKLDPSLTEMFACSQAGTARPYPVFEDDEQIPTTSDSDESGLELESIRPKISATLLHRKIVIRPQGLSNGADKGDAPRMKISTDAADDQRKSSSSDDDSGICVGDSHRASGYATSPSDEDPQFIDENDHADWQTPPYTPMKLTVEESGSDTSRSDVVYNLQPSKLALEENGPTTPNTVGARRKLNFGDCVDIGASPNWKTAAVNDDEETCSDVNDLAPMELFESDDEQFRNTQTKSESHENGLVNTPKRIRFKPVESQLLRLPDGVDIGSSPKFKTCVLQLNKFLFDECDSPLRTTPKPNRIGGKFDTRFERILDADMWYSPSLKTEDQQPSGDDDGCGCYVTPFRPKKLIFGDSPIKTTPRPNQIGRRSVRQLQRLPDDVNIGASQKMKTYTAVEDQLSSDDDSGCDIGVLQPKKLLFDESDNECQTPSIVTTKLAFKESCLETRRNDAAYNLQPRRLILDHQQIPCPQRKLRFDENDRSTPNTVGARRKLNFDIGVSPNLKIAAVNDGESYSDDEQILGTPTKLASDENGPIEQPKNTSKLKRRLPEDIPIMGASARLEASAVAAKKTGSNLVEVGSPWEPILDNNDDGFHTPPKPTSDRRFPGVAVRFMPAETYLAKHKSELDGYVCKARRQLDIGDVFTSTPMDAPKDGNFLFGEDVQLLDDSKMVAFIDDGDSSALEELCEGTLDWPKLQHLDEDEGVEIDASQVMVHGESILNVSAINKTDIDLDGDVSGYYSNTSFGHEESFTRGKEARGKKYANIFDA